MIKLILKKEKRKFEEIVYLSLYVKTLLNLRILSDLISLNFEVFELRF